MQKKRLCSRGQLSIEYLLLLAAFFSAILVFMPTIASLHANAVFASDMRNAQNFIDQLQNASEKMLVLGSGSQMEVDAQILTSWELGINGAKAILKVESKNIAKSKTLTAELAAPLNFAQKTFNSDFKLVLKNNNGKITIEQA